MKYFILIWFVIGFLFVGNQELMGFESSKSEIDLACIEKYKSWSLEQVLNGWAEMNNLHNISADDDQALRDMCASAVTHSRIDEMYQALEAGQQFSFVQHVKIIITAVLQRDARFCPYFIEFSKLRMHRADEDVSARHILHCGKDDAESALNDLEKYVLHNNLSESYLDEIESVRKRL